MKIITSLAPNKSAAQHLSTKSWIDLGFEIISINDPYEIKFLEAQYHYVSFKKCTLSHEDFPYIPIKRIVNEALNHDIVWILNSDIILKTNPQDISNINAMSSKGLVFGSRIDIDADREDKYEDGFDFFILNNKFSHLFRFNDIQLHLGLPWWDFWIPFLFLRKNVDIFYYNRPIAYHHIHNIQWNMDNFYKNACIVAKECGLNISLDRNDAHIFANFVYKNIRSHSKCLN